MNLDRRAFFRTLIPDFVEKKVATSTQEIVFPLGHLSVFPVNSEVKMNIHDEDYVIQSLPEGLRFVRIQTKENIRLALGQNGQVLAYLNEVWPTNAVLSIFSGEIYII